MSEVNLALATNALKSYIHDQDADNGETIEMSIQIDQRRQQKDHKHQGIEKQNGPVLQESIPSQSKLQMIAECWCVCIKYIRCIGWFIVGYVGVTVYTGILLAIFIACVFLLGGPMLIYRSTCGAYEAKKLMHRYQENGLRVNGRVEIKWRELEPTSSETSALIEKAIVSYDIYGVKYHMKIVPLDERVKETIVEGVIPIVIFPDVPSSGIPEACIETLAWSVAGQIVFFIGGCALSSYWIVMIFLCVSESTTINNFALLCITGGVTLNLLLVVCVAHTYKHNGHPALTFSERVEGDDVFSFRDNDMGLDNPLSEIDKKLRKLRCFPHRCLAFFIDAFGHIHT